MSTPSRAEKNEEVTGKKLQAERIALAIIQSVLRELGKPADLCRVAVIKLWDHHYRVNVQTGSNAVDIRIAHSFFLTANDDGRVLASIPAITRSY
jgi:hypothetical protein